jgi:hypothetical protein
MAGNGGFEVSFYNDDTGQWEVGYRDPPAKPLAVRKKKKAAQAKEPSAGDYLNTLGDVLFVNPRNSAAATLGGAAYDYAVKSTPRSVVRDITESAEDAGDWLRKEGKLIRAAPITESLRLLKAGFIDPLADPYRVFKQAATERARGNEVGGKKLAAMVPLAVAGVLPQGRGAGKLATKAGVEAAEKTAVKGATKAAAPKPKAAAPKAKPLAAKRPAQLEGADSPFMVSTRRPTAPNYATQGNPDEQLLIQTGEALRAAPPAFEKNMGMLAEEPFMRGMAGASPEQIYEEGVRRGADNLKFIMSDLMSPEKVEAARGWYPTAQMVSARAAERAGLPPEAGYGVAAVTSPQTPWDINVARVDRMMDMYGDRFATDPAAARKYIEGRMETKSPGAIAARGPEYAERIASMPYEELTDKFDKFARVSLADATRNDPMVRKIDLSGEYGEPYGSMTWGSGDSVSKALAIMDDPSMEGINAQLLGGGKVPSFFNNIANPYSAAPISTIDTHSAGAASLFPGGGNDPIVYRAMGLGPSKIGMPPAASDVARTGSKGLYGPISDMHTLAAKEMGFDAPREVQSATWEGVRDLWGQEGKTPELKKAIADIWNNSSSPDEARYLIAELLGKPVRRMFQVK